MNRPALIVAAVLVGVVALIYWQFSDWSIPASPGSTATSIEADASVEAPSTSVGVQKVVKAPQSAPLLDDDRPFAELRLNLERLARAGDGHAAWRLGMVLANCNQYVPISDGKLESVVVDLFASDRFKSDDGADVFMGKVLLGVAQKRRVCRNVSGLDEDAANSKAFQWMELGAALGDPDAQAMYATLAFDAIDARNALADAEQIQRRKRLALDYLERSLAQGDALALQQLSIVHADGLLFPANAELAYGYLYAFSLTPRANDFVPGLLDLLLDMRAQGLDAAALARAQEAGRRFATCCMAGTGAQP